MQNGCRARIQQTVFGRYKGATDKTYSRDRLVTNQTTNIHTYGHKDEPTALDVCKQLKVADGTPNK